jgi:TPP-dependent pyruvate/acetoin dehydrogenase alpha subunit
VDTGVADRDALQAVHDEVKAEVETAIQSAWDAPDPDPSTATRHVFAEDRA